MCKSKLYNELLNIISTEMEISIEEIRDRNIKTTEVVDARSILVFLLNESGLYPRQIAVLMDRTSANIRKLLGDYEVRKQNCKMIETYTQRIRNIYKSTTKLTYN